MPLQEWIHHWEVGEGARVLRVVAALLAFLALASLFDLLNYEYYSSEEAMENAQLARNLAEGKGYITDSIRPVALFLLENSADTGQSSAVLARPVADLSVAPVYPVLLAGLMKALPFKFDATQLWTYSPELWISVFNQVLFFAAVMLLFALARRLFEPRVAWLSVALFAGTKLFWRFSISGLSTILLILIFLLLVWLLAEIERRDREAEKHADVNLVPLAVLAGLLVGVGGLTRYAFAWMIAPVLLFVWSSVTRARVALCITLAAAFLAVMTPWMARNFLLSGHLFGTAGYSMLQDTPPLPDDTLERLTDPRGPIREVAPLDVVNKFLANARDICSRELPQMCGNWIAAFFLTGLLIPFRNPGLARLRWFLVLSLVMMLVVQAFGRTHVSRDAPEINSENLLVVLSPLVFVFGAALFHTLLDQWNLPPADTRNAAIWGFVAILCAPFWISLLAGRSIEPNSPYSPLHIYRTAGFMQTNELMTSDIPSGVAWYGRRSCVWLPLDNDAEFYKVNALKPIRALFLTQVTTDKRFLSKMVEEETGWGHFVLECAEHGEVPTGFPLRKAPAPRGYLPEQLFLSDRVRWQDNRVTP